MNASLRWLNQLLLPCDLTPEEATSVLVHLGFPIESREDFVDAAGEPDNRLDVEITSNRGDCLSHIGLAREIAAKTGRRLVLPPETKVTATGGAVASALSLENRTPEACPLFTARVIRGVKVGPSPLWLRRQLESIGQRSISNVVDVTNLLTFELGNPSHVFDLNKLSGHSLIVRYASEGEKLRTLDAKDRVLKSNELVVADAVRAQSLAGVIGGGESEVGADTVDVVLEVATWDPVTIRRAARRLAIRTDASYRFERIVDARTLELASRRGAALIVELAGGRLCEGVLTAGRPLPQTRSIDLRPARCNQIMGFDLPEAQMSALLAAQGLEPEPVISPAGSVIRCTVPAHRQDIVQEIDLIEEVARTGGLDAVPMLDRLPVQVRPPQGAQLATREIGSVLTGLGFFETVTFSFVRPDHGRLWLPAGLELVSVNDDRRGAEPTLRPSVVASLLVCRKANQDGQVGVEGGVRLFEIAAVYAQQAGTSATVENRNIALLADIPVSGKKVSIADIQGGMRTIRGAIETLVRSLGGGGGQVDFAKASPFAEALDASAFAEVSIAGRRVGYAGVVSAKALAAAGVDVPCVCAEINLGEICALYPAKTRITALPTFPAVERDLSPIVGETLTWDAVRGAVESTALPRLEGVGFVGTFRGKQIGAGKKSLTLRLRFRDPARTLRHEEVDGEIATIVASLNSKCGAGWRTV
ncbi:MAG: phenylalanine--tRNA ligase subunit beta [Planctomycetota bacterium]